MLKSVAHIALLTASCATTVEAATWRLGADATGSVIRSKAGASGYAALSEALQQRLTKTDAIEIILISNNKVTSAYSGSFQPGATNLLKNLSDLPFRGGDTRFSPLLEYYLARAEAGDVLIIATDGEVDTGSTAGDRAERQRIQKDAAELRSRGLRVWLIFFDTSSESHNAIRWLADTLQTDILTPEQLADGELARILPDTQPTPVTPHTELPAKATSAMRGRTRVIWVALVGVGVMVAAGVLWKRRRTPVSAQACAEASAPEFSSAPELWGEIAVAEAREAEMRNERVQGRDGCLRLGSADNDHFRHPGLMPNHVELKPEDEAITLTAFAPVRLDGMVLAGSALTPMRVKLPPNEEVAFSVRDVAYFVRLIIGDSK